MKGPTEGTSQSPLVKQRGGIHPALAEREWDKLLCLLKEKRVVPVIGPDLLRVQWDDLPSAKLYELWGTELARQFDLELPQNSYDIPLLYWVADQLSVRPDIPIGDMEYEYSTLISDAKWPVPQSLLQLAEIKDFPLYISTTIDHLMDTALSLKRGGGKHIYFRRSGGSSQNDLPSQFSPSPNPTIIHLFGASSVDPEAFAATEDDLIEFSWNLIDHDSSPKNLYDYLHRKILLLLGCDFPDWLDRFFIHALSHEQGAQVAITFVSERCPKGLQEFLRRKKARPYIQCSPVDFVHELYQRWQKNEIATGRLEDGKPLLTQPASIGTSYYTPSKPGSVFISYARDDKAKAIAIRDQLEAANIDTWMDDTGLEPGAEFDDVIHDNIKQSSFFVALISKAMNLEGSNRFGRYVLKEWRWAKDADMERPSELRFLQPVVIDDTPPGAPFIERPFRDRHWTVYDNGQLPSEFIEFLKHGIRRFRTARNDI